MKEVTNLLIKIYRNKLIKWILIPLVLILFWIVCSLFFNSYVGLTTILNNYDKNVILKTPHGQLLKGESIVGEFKATQNNLGIVAVGFTNTGQGNNDNQDTLVFRIKENGATSWWYQNEYKSSAIYSLPLYPFGFPKITDSQMKTYTFSITSLHGNKINALQLSSQTPIVVAKYVYSKNELVANKKTFLQFIMIKLFTSFTDISFLKASFVYILPLFFYLFWNIVVTKLYVDRYSFLFVTPLLIVLAITTKVDLVVGVFMALIGFWIITIIIYDAESSISYLFAVIFFALAFVSIFLNYQNLGGRLSNWTYIYLVIGTVQLSLEYKQSSKKKLTYEIFLKSIFQQK